MFKKVKKWKIFVAIGLLILGALLTFVSRVEVNSAPAAPMTTLTSEIPGSYSMNSSWNIRDWIMPIFFLAIIFMALQEGFRIRKEAKQDSSVQ